jgi:hypothetical protein
MGGGDSPDISGMLGLVSAFDDLGCTYAPVLGQDPAAAERIRFRMLVAEFLGVGRAKAGSLAAAGGLFLERDWMLENERYRGNSLECLADAENLK